MREIDAITYECGHSHTHVRGTVVGSAADGTDPREGPYSERRPRSFIASGEWVADETPGPSSANGEAGSLYSFPRFAEVFPLSNRANRAERRDRRS